MRVYTAILIFVAAVKSVQNANILAIFPLPGKSHFVMFERILKELASRGHDVDVVGHFPLKDPVPGYNDLSILGSQAMFVNNITYDQVHFPTIFHTLNFMLYPCGLSTCESAFATPVLQNLKKTSKKYDLLISEVFTTDCMLGFAHKWKIPVVSFTSSIHFPWASERLALPDNPSYIPTYFVNYGTEMTLFQRIYNVYTLFVSKMMYKWSTWRTNQVAREFFGDEELDIEAMTYNISALFVNSHFSANGPRPAVPGFVEVGGIHMEELRPLPKYFEEIMTKNSNGVIYFSIGSLIRSDTLPDEKLQALFDAFGALPHLILWKGDRTKFKKSIKIPNNIHFEQWIPQLDVLCHPNLKVFISHGGLMSTQEAIYCGVPRLGIPFFADQDLNVRQSEILGLAKRVTLSQISKETVLNALKDLISNPKYKETNQKLSQIYKDRPMSPLETAVYWIEYVIRYRGAPHLSSAAIKLAWYQYYFVDMALIAILVIFGSRWVIKAALNSICKREKRKKE